MHVRNRTGSVARLAAPLKGLIQRFAFLLLFVSAFVLMLLGKGETLLIDRFRTGVLDFVTPVMEVLSQPAAAVANAVENMKYLYMLRTENERLREENAKLREWQAAAHRLETENASLRELLRVPAEAPARYITARVIADPGGAFVRAAIVNAGRRDGVVKGQAVMTADGLVGRIYEVGLYSARVLLVTDINSRLPVLIESSRARAILAGDNGDRPKLAFLSATVEVSVGDRIITSGQGGMFPPGLPIGTVAAIEGGVVRVEPLVDFDRLEMVRVIDFGIVEPVPISEGASRKK
jgi:rod shape-determining protein MreC